MSEPLEQNPMFLQLVKLTTHVEVLSSEMKNLSRYEEERTKHMERESERSRQLSEQVTRTMGSIESLGVKVANTDRRIDDHIGSHWKWATFIFTATGATMGFIKTVWGKVLH